ncbi:cell division protein ZapA [Allopseudospirillum japonicum]|uniref:Cell division protein ZapA n=1 Tax=Allopseudospirillum japonicum TaxID=64971 RepID=A0A1H6QY89_9GAMM|nr:cell division protein ZapA [Allopseudospirillum japonicum]SEI45157.1 cell division protein ZapA [Allopseudospirillum japonicum]
MSNSKHTTEITLMDRKFMISCPPEEKEALMKAANYLNKKMHEIRSSGKLLSMERIAVMAALNISHELLQKDEFNHNTHSKISQMRDKLDEALGAGSTHAAYETQETPEVSLLANARDRQRRA